MNAGESHFERRKNLQALGITAGILFLLALMLVLVSWTHEPQPLPVPDEGVEVNLGNSDQGFGTVPPQLPGEPSQEASTQVSPPPPASQSAQEETRPSDETDGDLSAAKAKAPKPTHTETVESKRPPAPKAVIVPPAPKPKALYAGGKATNRGGNNADSYNGVRNQGIAGGNGDQGKPNGNPNSDSYTGNGGSGRGGPVSIRSGLQGRRLTALPSFEDDFNENAKVAVDVTVTATGSVSAALINPRGTTTINPNIKSIALRKARELHFNAGSSESQGTIVFNFKLKG